MPASHIPSSPRRPAVRLRRFGVGLLATVLLGGLLPPAPLNAQIPGIIEPFDNVTELYLRANRLYEYGRDNKPYAESRRALHACIPIFREFINTAPNVPD